MKLIGSFTMSILFFSCAKQGGTGEDVSLTASSNQVAVGETVSVTAHTKSNVVSWTVSPASAASKVYAVTTEKTNYFSFSQPGDYVLGARTGELTLDSIHHCNHADSTGHHLPDSLWNAHVDSLWLYHGLHKKHCKDGLDSASIHILVH